MWFARLILPFMIFLDPACLKIEVHFQLLQFAVVLLQHIGRFQKLCEYLLVEDWLGVFFGHDFGCCRRK